MITGFNALRESIEPPDRQRKGQPLREAINGERTYALRLEYAKAMALIQIAQDLHEIKTTLTEGNIRIKGDIEGKINK